MEDFGDEDKKLFAAIQEEIQTRADKEEVALAKSTRMGIVDSKGIKSKYEQKVFDGLKTQLMSLASQCLPFFVQLKEDNPSLYEKLIQGKISEEELSKNLSTYASMKEYAKAMSSVFTKEEQNTLYASGKNWFIQNRFEEAHLYFLFLSILDAKNPDFLLAKGITEQNLTRYDEAMKSYLDLIHLDPTFFPPYLQMVECLVLQNKLDEARQLYSDIEKEASSFYKGHEIYGSKMEQLQRLTKAVA